jgi:hypothetical protein
MNDSWWRYISDNKIVGAENRRRRKKLRMIFVLSVIKYEEGLWADSAYGLF